MTALPDDLRPILADLLLAAADDKLLLGHANSDWTGLAPILEEDIAFSSIAQDEMAHAQALYEVAGSLLDKSADDLAFGRGPGEYRCAAIVLSPDEFDWARAIARQLFCDHFDLLRLGRMSRSAHKPLGALARRLEAEERIHTEHADAWVRRLGRGTGESRDRMQAALDALAPLAFGLFEPVRGQERLEAAGLHPGSDAVAYASWAKEIRAVVEDAGLSIALPAALPAPAPGGRRGKHPARLTAILDEMCEVYRLAPGARW